MKRDSRGKKSKNSTRLIPKEEPCNDGNHSETLRQRIDDSYKTLDRIDSWINSCDNKISVLIGIMSVVCTICITTDSVNRVYSFAINVLLSNINITKIVFIILFVVSLGFDAIAFRCIVGVVFARVDNNRYSQKDMPMESNLYFGSIAERSFLQFKKSYLHESPTEQINDILSQIYINSKIARKKYNYYNKSLKWMCISALSTALLVLLTIVWF